MTDACMTPVYLSRIHNLKEEDTRTWELLNESQLPVSKPDVPFTSIELDHGIEQENRAIKVLGSIKGIANSHQALVEEYFFKIIPV